MSISFDLYKFDGNTDRKINSGTGEAAAAGVDNTTSITSVNNVAEIAEIASLISKTTTADGLDASNRGKRLSIIWIQNIKINTYWKKK